MTDMAQLGDRTSITSVRGSLSKKFKKESLRSVGHFPMSLKHTHSEEAFNKRINGSSTYSVSSIYEGFSASAHQ